jgi:hypothetical protein
LQAVLQVLSILITLFALWKPGGKNDFNKNLKDASGTYKESEKIAEGAGNIGEDDTDKTMMLEKTEIV